MKLIGDKIYLRLAEESDSEFILTLRQNKELNKFISPTNINIIQQQEWIKKYKEREKEGKEYYFIVINKKKEEPCGTVRIYNIDKLNRTATWGSFILDSNRPDGASKETIKFSLDFAFQNLKLNKIFLDVRKENGKAIHIYEKFGFKRIKEDFLNFYYSIM